MTFPSNSLKNKPLTGKNTTYLMLLLIVFASSCRKITNTQPAFTSASFPLTVGNWWQYQITSIGSAPDTFMLSVASLTSVGVYTQYNCNLKGSGGFGPVGYFLESDTSLSFLNVPNSYFVAFPNFHIKFPVQTGQYWPGAYPPKDTILVSTVEDSCGGYGHDYGPCYYIHEAYNLPHNFMVNHFLLTPKVGLIQQSITFNSDTAGVQIQQSITLLNYHIQ